MRVTILSPAVRSPTFLELAVDLALSLREHDPTRPLSVVVDTRLRQATEGLE